jgi:hypothetical protein
MAKQQSCNRLPPGQVCYLCGSRSQWVNSGTETSMRLPAVTEIRSVTEAEFTAADSVCEASERPGRQELREAPDE